MTDGIDWDNAHSVIKSQIYDSIEQKIHELYNEGRQIVRIRELVDSLNISEKYVKNIIESLYSQGIVEYIEDEKELVLNDEDYSDIDLEDTELWY